MNLSKCLWHDASLALNVSDHGTVSCRSRVSEQQQAFHQSRSQIQELEFLKRTKQDLIAILTAKQRTINGLKRELTAVPSGDRECTPAVC